MRIGVLALQGGFAAHATRLTREGYDVVAVRTKADVVGLEGLVLPGGESTTQLLLMRAEPGLIDALDDLVRSGVPVLATCAGLIVAAELGWIDVDVRRNGYGPQLHSAEALADDGTPLILIRAPRIERVGPGVVVERTLSSEPVLVRSGAVLAATYHPELVTCLAGSSIDWPTRPAET